MPTLGHCHITDARWIGPFDLRVAFATQHTTKLHQLYVGRSLVACTETFGDSVLFAIVQPSLYPQHLTLLAVDPSEKATDFGADLPPRPFNRVKVGFSTIGWPADSKLIVMTAGDAPGDAVNPDNELLRIEHDIAREYEVIGPPMSGTGDWNLELVGEDNVGNAGTATDFDQHVYAHPPDVAFADDGTRFTAQAVAGNLNVVFAL